MLTGQALNKKKRALSKTPTLGESTPEKPAKRLRVRIPINRVTHDHTI